MLTTNQLRQVANRSGARDLGNVDIDVILTHLLQLFHERGLAEHLAFKGGTLLRKMHFGARGRLSTDLDFTRASEVGADDLMMLIIEALHEPYHGIAFRLEREKDWYINEDGISANPVCSHDANPRGIKIKLQISTRETAVLPVLPQAQLDQDYFRLLPFKPASVPSLAFEEAVAEKIRAATQRSKIRDLYDLSELAKRPLDQARVRGLAALKLWNSGGQGLDYEVFKTRIEGAADYDVADLRNLLRKDENPDLGAMIARVVQGFRFLQDMSDLEQRLAVDVHKQSPQTAEELIVVLRG